MSAPCDVLLVFVNNNEKEAVYSAFKERFNRDPVIKPGKILTYHDFGIIGGARVSGLQTEMGSITPGGSVVSILDALYEKAPQYVILVGIAFGMDRQKQQLWDILVSQKVSQYEIGKIGKGKKGEDLEIQRGDTVTVPEGILGKFRALSDPPHWQGAAVHFGLMVSGEKLIDNMKFKAKLKKKYPEAIGGDMEAAGAYTAARRYKRDWIVVKAVCDYADGNKKRNKDKNQKIAARNAARLVFHVLEKGNFAGFPIISSKKKEKEENKRKKTTGMSRALIKKRIKENINKLLDKRKTERFRHALTRLFNKEKNEKKQYKNDQMAAALIDMSVLDAVLIMDQAVKYCIDAIKDADGSVDLINSTWNNSISILGWLVLLGVDDEWADIASQCLADKGGNLELSIPVETGAGAEIAVSRLNETKAHLRFDEATKQVVGEKGIPGDSWNIEDGWHPADKVLTIKKALWKQLIKVDPPGNGEFTKNMNDELNETILIRRKKGEHHYIAVHQSCQDNPLLEPEVYKALIRDLPDLDIFLIGSTEEGAAIIGEPKLHARLREFFRNHPG
jgi:nucleoside phosphorylase